MAKYMILSPFAMQQKTFSTHFNGISGGFLNLSTQEVVSQIRVEKGLNPHEKEQESALTPSSSHQKSPCWRVYQLSLREGSFLNLSTFSYGLQSTSTVPLTLRVIHKSRIKWVILPSIQRRGNAIQRPLKSPLKQHVWTKKEEKYLEFLVYQDKLSINEKYKLFIKKCFYPVKRTRGAFYKRHRRIFKKLRSKEKKIDYFFKKLGTKHSPWCSEEDRFLQKLPVHLKANLQSAYSIYLEKFNLLRFENRKRSFKAFKNRVALLNRNKKKKVAGSLDLQRKSLELMQTAFLEKVVIKDSDPQWKETLRIIANPNFLVD